MHKDKRRNSMIWEVWKRLKQDKMAIAGLVVLTIMLLVSVFAEFILPYPYDVQSPDKRLLFPNKEHLFGTDNFGRDIFSRILYGTRYTMIIGFGCTTAAAIMGTALGAIAGFFHRVDNLIMRFIDIIMGIPIFMLAISIIAALGSSMQNMMIALSITSMPAFARIVRAQVLTLKEQEFIEAARSIGAGNTRLLIKHILPNALAPIIVQYTLGTAFIILWGASLSFIGMGVQAPTPEWGLMVSAGRNYLQDYWYMSIIPGLAIVVATYSLNLLGDGLRDALDPRLKN